MNKREITQIKNKIKNFHGNPVLATYEIVSNSLSGEFILFFNDDNLGFALTKCFKKDKPQSIKSPAYTKLSNQIGYDLVEKIEEMANNIVIN